MNKKTSRIKERENSDVKTRVAKIEINPTTVVYIDEWYLEELVDIIKEYPAEKYSRLISKLASKRDKRRKASFPQKMQASHMFAKKGGFNEFKTMEEYIEGTWFNESKISLLKVSNEKKMMVKLSSVGATPHVPSYLNNLSPNNMLSFLKNKSSKFKKATILINISGHMHWKDYKKIIRQFFKTYDFERLSLGNISKTEENGINYYRITVVKVRNGVNINGQGLMLESADFLRRLMFMIYEIDPTDQVWDSYGNTVLNEEIESIKVKEPYFAAILEQYLNPSIILVE